MASKQISPKSSIAPQTKKTGGGTAVGGGVNFQATTTVIVAVHILHGSALNWLEGVCHDKPIAVWAESEGPGDDLRIELEDNISIEVQAKKGLTRGSNLWTSLHSMAKAIHNNHLAYGVLAVNSDSSETICEKLALDIERLGQGRTDNLTSIGTDWAQQLSDAKIPAQQVCRNMRIKVIHALSADDISICAAKERLRHVCAKDEDVDSAWSCLYRHAVCLIERRGRWTLQDLIRLLRSSNIAIRENDFPASVFERYSKWVIEANSHFFITGIKRKIPLKHLLPMHLQKLEFTQASSEDASAALERYHKSAERKLYGEEFDAIWTARFKKLAVVVAGPGLGKSTMIKALAHQYAQDGYWVLSVPLKPIAAAMQNGEVFSELLLKHAFDGSPLLPNQMPSVNRVNLVILADGLDECGSSHHEVATQLHRFSLGNSSARIIVTTRPIGYDTAVLSNWSHYRLLSPRKEDGKKNLTKLLSSVLREPSIEPDLSLYQLETPPSDAISISPQLLGMSASLIYHHSTLPHTRQELYIQLISLYEKLPADASEQLDFYVTALNSVGWILIEHPLISFDKLIDRTAERLAPMMGTKPMALKKDIRLAIAHWESVGLVEKVFHNEIALLTFVHKTFCEFVASRFFIQNSQELIEDVVDHPEKQEVLDFAIGFGLVDNLIELYLSRHANGRPQQLQPALALLGKPGINISDQWAQELVRQSFKAIEAGASDKFSIGIALSDVGAKAAHLIEPQASSNLDVGNPALKLVAWAIVISNEASCYSAVALSTVLDELLSTVEQFDIRDIFEKKDRGDRDLLGRIACAALKAQSDVCARSFAEQMLKNKTLQTFGFNLKVNHILKSRGLEEFEFTWPNDAPRPSMVSLSPIGPSWRDGSIQAMRSIANVFASENTQTEIGQEHSSSLVQFAGFLRASGYMASPISDLYSWLEAYEQPALHSTLKTVARLIPLDEHELANDAREILRRLNAGLCDSIHTILPAVDIDGPNWDQAQTLSFNRDEVMLGLLHPSYWVNCLAACICCYLEMSLNELESLLRRVKGYSIQHVITLIKLKYPEKMVKILLQRLCSDSSGDVSAIFKILCELVTKPPHQLMNITLTCLCSPDSNTAEAATELLSYWVDLGIQIDERLVVKAIEHWGGEGDSRISNSFLMTPRHSLIELQNKINTA